jgi:hypothetical protein
MAMMDHGEHGKVMIEQSYRIRGVSNGGGAPPSIAHAAPDYGSNPFDGHEASYGPPPAYAPPPRSRRLSLGGGSAGGHRAPAGLIGAPPSMSGLDLMPYGGGASADPYSRSARADPMMALAHMPRSMSVAPHMGAGGYGYR